MKDNSLGWIGGGVFLCIVGILLVLFITGFRQDTEIEVVLDRETATATTVTRGIPFRPFEYPTPTPCVGCPVTYEDIYKRRQETEDERPPVYRIDDPCQRIIRPVGVRCDE